VVCGSEFVCVFVFFLVCGFLCFGVVVFVGFVFFFFFVGFFCS